VRAKTESRDKPVRELAFVSTRSGKATIWLSDENGGFARELPPNHPGAIDISWSPDGQTLFFATQLSANTDMYVLEKGIHSIYSMDMETGIVTQLTDHDCLQRYPEMSPDGKTIVFLCDRGTEDRQIWAMNHDGTEQRRITDLVGHKSRPTFSPDGSQIAVQLNRPSAQIYLMKPDGSALTNISNNRFSERYPSWSGDGKQLTFTSIRKGYIIEDGLLMKLFWKVIKPFTGRMRSVWLMNCNGENQRQLLQLPAGFKHADFSPDGEVIVFESDLEGESNLHCRCNRW
jgi:Tol biopolymer transport system component